MCVHRNRDDESRRGENGVGSSAQTHHAPQRRGQWATTAKLQRVDGLAEGALINGDTPGTGKLEPATTAERTGQHEIRRSLQWTAAFLADWRNDQSKVRSAPVTEWELTRLPANLADRWEEKVGDGTQ